MVSPGGGAGNQAAARGILKSVIPSLHQALMVFPVNGPEYKAIDRALAALTPAFGKSADGNLVPAALLQQANAVKQGGGSPLGGSAPPLSPSPPPGAEGPPGGPPGM
jgi:hypothetical protein